ncbi:MAG: Glycerol ABC transporter, permease protein GlpQ, partial [uncultured Truepera sp.]
AAAPAHLLDDQHVPEAQPRDSGRPHLLPARADLRQLPHHLHRPDLVHGLRQFTHLRRHEHGDVASDRAARRLRLFTVSLSGRESPVFLAADQPHGSGGGLFAAVFPALPEHRALRHPLGRRARAPLVQRAAGGVDSRGLYVRSAARDRRDGGGRRLQFPEVFPDHLFAAHPQRNRGHGVFLLYVQLGRAAAGAHLDERRGEADRSDHDPHGERLGDGLGSLGRSRCADYHSGRAGHLFRPQPYRQRLCAGARL